MSAPIDALISEQDGLPVVDIMQPAYWQHTHEVLRAVRQKSRVYRATPFMIAAFGRFDDVETLLRDDRLGSPLTASLEAQGIVDGPLHDWWSNTILFNDAPVHTRLRSLVSKAFTPRRVQEMRPVTRAICTELLDELVPRGEFDFLGEFAHHVPIRVIATMLGVPTSDYKTFAEWTAALSGAFHVILTPEIRKEVEDAIIALREYADELIAFKKRAPGDDLLSALIEAEESGERLNGEELKAMIIALLFAGHDTTKSLLTIGVKTLIDHPDAYRALQRDASLAEPVVEEILRYESPVTGVIRKVREPFEYAGLELSEGQIVFFSLLSSPTASTSRERTSATSPLGWAAIFVSGALWVDWKRGRVCWRWRRGWTSRSSRASRRSGSRLPEFAASPSSRFNSAPSAPLEPGGLHA
jgi:cytochrome P450